MARSHGCSIEFPSQTNQLIARRVRKFMMPESTREDALKYAKEFLKRGGEPTQDAQPKLETENETEVFDSMWDDTFVLTEPVPDQTCRMPSAPSGPAASATALTTERASPPEEEIALEFVPLDCSLQTSDPKTESFF